MPGYPSADPVLAYARKPRRRWRLFLLLLSTFSAAALIYKLNLPKQYQAWEMQRADCAAEQKCLAFDAASLPQVLFSKHDFEVSTIVTSGTEPQALTDFIRANNAISPPMSPGMQGLGYPLLKLDAHYSTLLMHEAVRPDGVHRLIAVGATDNVLSVSAWTVATKTQPSKQVSNYSKLFQIILPPDGSMSIHAITDPADLHHPRLQADLLGTTASVHGTIEILLHTDDTISLRPTFGRLIIGGVTIWLPASGLISAGKP